MDEEIKMAYVAGFIDGEGHLGIKANRTNYAKTKKYNISYSERISVAGVDEKAIRAFDDIVKGHIYFHKGSKLSNRGYWSWEVTNNKARVFLAKIYPYLRVKKAEAEVIMQLSENKTLTNKGKIPDEDIRIRRNLYLKLKRMHSGK